MTSVTFVLDPSDAIGLLGMGQVGVVPRLAVPEVVRTEVIGIRAIQFSRLIGGAGILKPMVHADHDHLPEAQVIGDLQGGIGYCPAFVHALTDVMAEAFGRTRRVDAVSQSVFVNETISAIADELDAIQFADVIGGLFQHLAIHGDVVFRVEIELAETEKDLVHPDHRMLAKERQIHPVERGTIGDEHAAFAGVAVVNRNESVHELNG